MATTIELARRLDALGLKFERDMRTLEGRIKRGEFYRRHAVEHREGGRDVLPATGGSGSAHKHLIIGTVDGVLASTTLPFFTTPPMPEGGTIIAVFSRCQQNRAIGATAWIGDVQKITAANANTTTDATIFSTKPTITNGNYYQAHDPANLSVTTFDAGDMFSFYTEQAGTSAPFIAIGLHVEYDG